MADSDDLSSGEADGGKGSDTVTSFFVATFFADFFLLTVFLSVFTAEDIVDVLLSVIFVSVLSLLGIKVEIEEVVAVSGEGSIFDDDSLLGAFLMLEVLTGFGAFLAAILALSFGFKTL